jgi:small-conductance mechanosensitive channel
MDVNDTSQKPPAKTRQAETTHKFWIGGYAILALLSLAFWLLFGLHIFESFGSYLPLIKKVALGCFFVFVILVMSRSAEMVVSKKSHTRSMRYNLARVIRLLTVLLVLMVIISFIFEKWYTAAVSLGLISLILGFALQIPISSLIGWLYIVIRSPYRIGDRIQVNTFTGDVVEIGYLDTTLWEFGGEYLTSDLPSGRLIRFPNTLVLQSAVFNYSWSKFPFIWNEIPFHIAYESDLLFVEKTLREVTKDELGPGMTEKVKDLKILIEKTPIDELEIKEYPFVNFRTNANTWLEAIVVYLVRPKQAASVRSRIIKEAVKRLLEQPDKVMFPKSNAR